MTMNSHRHHGIFDRAPTPRVFAAFCIGVGAVGLLLVFLDPWT